MAGVADTPLLGAAGVGAGAPPINCGGIPCSPLRHLILIGGLAVESIPSSDILLLD